jgi:hypothetical protein
MLRGARPGRYIMFVEFFEVRIKVEKLPVFLNGYGGGR